MRTALASFACLTLWACQTLPTNHTLRGKVELGVGGQVIGKFTAQGTDRIHVVVDNDGPGALSYVVADDQGRTLESGVIEKTRGNFTWRPLESFVTFTVRAPDRAATFDYRVASETPFTVEWNKTDARAPAR